MTYDSFISHILISFEQLRLDLTLPKALSQETNVQWLIHIHASLYYVCFRTQIVFPKYVVQIFYVFCDV